MQEIIQNITDRVSFDKKDKFSKFLYRCIKISKDYTGSSVLFKINVFFEGLAKMTNSLPKAKKLVVGVETLTIVFEELGFELEPEEAFILYHLRDLGKFKIKDSKLKEQLAQPWKEHKEYALNDHDFSLTIKALTKMGLIEHKKGTLNLKLDLTVHFQY